MKVPDKIDLVDQIARELKFLGYGYDEIDALLHGYEIPGPEGRSFNNSFEYTKIALLKCKSEKIIDIANDLDINVDLRRNKIDFVPINWSLTKNFRLFISHISKDKDKAKRLKECLLPFHIDGFVAHEDIHPTAEWQTEIERALTVMDAFVALHTTDFSKSIWTQQEIGFAVGRRVKIISVKMGEDPTGFISKVQALPRRQRQAEEIALEIHAILSSDEDAKEKLHEAQKAAEIAKNLENIPF